MAEKVETRFVVDDLNPENGEPYIVISRDSGLEIDPLDANNLNYSGIVLRGEDAVKYQRGDNVSIGGVGIINQTEGIVRGLLRNRGQNTMPWEPSAISETAARKGESADPDEFDSFDPDDYKERFETSIEDGKTVTRKIGEKSADQPADKSRRTVTAKPNGDGKEVETKGS